MPDDKSKPKPEIPVGKLVSGKSEKPTAPKPKPAAPPPAPAARPAPAPNIPTVPAVPSADNFDVDLVAVPCPPPQPRKPRDQRSLFDLDRRDFIMMGTGVGGSVLAVLAGLLMAKAFQRKPTEEKPKPGE
jgi:hypothetical protein